MSNQSTHTGWQPNDTPTRIVICHRCNGRGVFHHTETTDYHKGTTRTTTTPCACCKGSGRMRSTLTFTPYIPPNS